MAVFLKPIAHPDVLSDWVERSVGPGSIREGSVTTDQTLFLNNVFL